MEITWRQLAVEDLEDARRSIGEHNPEAARRIFAAIISAVERLAGMPYIGCPGRVPGTRELVVVGTHSVVAYAVLDGQLAILAVMQGARQWPEQFC
jgi:toxin ParE1/3/4